MKDGDSNNAILGWKDYCPIYCIPLPNYNPPTISDIETQSAPSIKPNDNQQFSCRRMRRCYVLF